MNSFSSEISGRYELALYDLSKENNQTEEFVANIKEFMKVFNSNESQRFFIKNHTYSVEDKKSIFNNILEIENEIMPPRRLKGFGGRTAIKDAILTGVGDLIKDKESESKIMVFFTDGETNSDKSPQPMEDVIKVALHKKINIVTVAYGSELTNA